MLAALLEDERDFPLCISMYHLTALSIHHLEILYPVE